MKLYATTTSERASKGQGGQKYIEIEITTENREQCIGRIKYLMASDTDIIMSVSLPNGYQTTERIRNIILKGEKKKGEICRHCGRVHKNDTAICL